VVDLVLGLLNQVAQLFKVALQLKNFEQIIVQVDLEIIHLQIKNNSLKN
jgi:hypothetical protein